VKNIHAGIALGVGAGITLEGMIRLPFILNIQGFWNYPKPALAIIFLVGMIFTALLIKDLVRLFMEQISTKSGVRFYIWVLILYSLFLVALNVLRLPNPLTPLSSFWLQGKRGILVTAQP
jgi:hypothetical protein